MTTGKARGIVDIIPAHPVREGAGVKVYRTIATPRLDHLDPFMLLDAFDSDDPHDYVPGFPEHPHRGIETVTYMLEGRIRHADSLGNSGVIGPGDVQWMTAGRGILHSEMPHQKKGPLRGFQLWINLASADKMGPPRYQDISSSEIPEVEADEGTRIRVIAGAFDSVRGPVTGVSVDPLFLDVSLAPKAGFMFEVPREHAAFAYVFEGSGSFGNGDVEARSLVVLGEGDRVVVAAPRRAMSFLLVAARPLREPVARWGPFVMNTKEEIARAIEDYRNGTLALRQAQGSGN